MRTLRWSILAALLISALSSGCFSRFSVTRYRSDTVQVKGLKVAALLPIMISSAPGSEVSIEAFPPWIEGTRSGSLLTVAERAPAEQLFRALLVKSLPVQWITPEEVDRAMAGATPSQLDRAIPEIAKRTRAEGVVAITIKNFHSRRAGTLNAEASGDVTIAVYAPTGGLAWSLQAHVVRGPAGSNAPPSLLHFVQYAIENLGTEVEAMAR
jgi:hypothetical protein